MKIKSNKDKLIDKIAESSAEMSTMILLQSVNDWNEYIVYMLIRCNQMEISFDMSLCFVVTISMFPWTSSWDWSYQIFSYI